MKYLITLITFITMGISAEGEIGGVTYFDFTNAKEKSAFNFNRQYFSYGIEMSDDIKFTIVFDVGRTNKIKDGDDKDLEDTRLFAFLKKAQADYKISYGKVSMGLISMNTYGVQENNWGYRFIEQSSLDKYGYSLTTDLGIGFSRSLIENLNMSLQVVNGEGFKKPQGDKYYKISFNTTYGEPKLNKNDGYNAGLVYSTEATDSVPTIMVSAFGGFAGMGLRLGAEYDALTKDNIESNIISVSVNYGVMDNIDVFVRYDMYDDKNTIVDNDKNYLIAGILLDCGNGLSVAPNMRMTFYEADTDSETEYKVNFQFKF